MEKYVDAHNSSVFWLDPMLIICIIHLKIMREVSLASHFGFGLDPQLLTHSSSSESVSSDRVRN